MRLGPSNLFQIDTLFHHLPQGTQLSQSCHWFLQRIQKLFYFFLRSKPADPDTKRSVGKVFADSQCSKHIGRLQRLTGASRTRTNCIVFHCHQQALSFNECERHVDVSVVSLAFVSVELNMSHSLPNCVYDFMVKSLNVSCIIVHFSLCHLAGLSQTDHQRRG